MAETAKQEILQIIERMPDNVSLEDVLYELYVRSEIERGLEDAQAGRTIPHDEVIREIKAWLRSPGQGAQ